MGNRTYLPHPIDAPNATFGGQRVRTPDGNLTVRGGKPADGLSPHEDA